MSHKQVIVLRKDLNMRKGKMVAQGAHASMAAILDLMYHMDTDENQYIVLKLDERLEPWIKGTFKKICVGVNSEQELIDIHSKAVAAGLICSLIKDSGLTEFGGIPTYTAVAVGPDFDSVVDAVTGHLSLL